MNQGRLGAQDGETAAAALRAALLDTLPGVQRWLLDHGPLELVAACTGTPPASARPWPAPSPALRRCLYQRTAVLLGETVAQSLDRRLGHNPAVLVANHHGINSHPEFFQAVMLFALADLLAQDAQQRVIPVLACSTVALRSYSYPRGLLGGRPQRQEALLRLPLFPESAGDLMVTAAPALSKMQVHKAAANWRTLPLLSWERASALEILDQHLLDDSVLELPTFSAQASRLNARLWQACHSAGPSPTLVYLDLEDIGREMLLHDLADEQSLCSRLLCQASLRDRVYTGLAGYVGCWDRTEKKRGTAFLWRRDRQGRRRRLNYRPGEDVLTDGGTTIALHREALMEALAGKQLYPGLFCTCVLLALVHGLHFHGGMYMLDYMPAMLQELTRILESFGLQTRAPLPPVRMGSGIMPLHAALTKSAKAPPLPTAIFPAGLLEVLAAREHYYRSLQEVAHLTVNSVCPMTLAAWYKETLPPASRLPGWRDAVTHLIRQSAGIQLSLSHD